VENVINSGETKLCGEKGEGDDFWVSFTFQSPVTVRGYAIQSGNDESCRDPAHWTVLIRDKSGEMVTAASVDGQDHFEDRHETKRWALDKKFTTDKVELRVHRSNDDSNGLC